MATGFVYFVYSCTVVSYKAALYVIEMKLDSSSFASVHNKIDVCTPSL